MQFSKFELWAIKMYESVENWDGMRGVCFTFLILPTYIILWIIVIVENSIIAFVEKSYY